MFNTKQFNYLLLILPIIYLAHNLEEWLVLTHKITEIRLMLPSLINDFLVQKKVLPLQIFGIGLIFASILPFMATFMLWGNPTVLNVRILVVIAFATVINSLSHIGSSIALGFFSPGVITAITLCLPYSVWVLWSIKGRLVFSIKNSFFLFLVSLVLYFLVIVISWFIGYLGYILLYS